MFWDAGGTTRGLILQTTATTALCRETLFTSLTAIVVDVGNGRPFHTIIMIGWCLICSGVQKYQPQSEVIKAWKYCVKILSVQSAVWKIVCFLQIVYTHQKKKMHPVCKGLYCHKISTDQTVWRPSTLLSKQRIGSLSFNYYDIQQIRHRTTPTQVSAACYAEHTWTDRQSCFNIYHLKFSRANCTAR